MISEEALLRLTPNEPFVRSNELPGPNARAVLNRLERNEFSDGYNVNNPLVISGGQGCVFDDCDGNRFMDLNILWSLCYLGMGHPKVQERLYEAAGRNNRAGDIQTDARAELVEKIINLLPAHSREGAQVAFTLTGSQASEMAVRLAMRATGRRRVVAFSNCYHGGWGLAWEFASQSRYRTYDWGNKTLSVTHVPFPYTYRCPLGSEPEKSGDACADLMEYMLTSPNSGVDDVACVIVEAIQNMGHVKPPQGWLKRVRELCDRIGAILIVDATANGFAVSGNVFEHVEQGVDADIVTIGKGIANSLPLSALILNADVAERAKGIAVYNGGTAHPIVLEASLATLDAMFDAEDNLLGRARIIEEAAKAALAPLAERCDVVGELRIFGFTGAVELVRSKETKEPVASARQAGSPLNLMLHSTESSSIVLQGYPFFSGGPHFNTIRWCVPMTTPLSLFNKAVDRLVNAIEANAEALKSV